MRHDMDAETLKAALNDPKVSDQSTESARNSAVSAREQTHETLDRMDEQVQLEVAKAIGANVVLRAAASKSQK